MASPSMPNGFGRIGISASRRWGRFNMKAWSCSCAPRWNRWNVMAEEGARRHRALRGLLGRAAGGQGARPDGGPAQGAGQWPGRAAARHRAAPRRWAACASRPGSPAHGLHPTIPAHAPLVIEIWDGWRKRSLGGCTYHVAHPGGRNSEIFPVNAYEAEGRQIGPFRAFRLHRRGVRRAPGGAQPRFPLHSGPETLNWTPGRFDSQRVGRSRTGSGDTL